MQGTAPSRIRTHDNDVRSMSASRKCSEHTELYCEGSQSFRRNALTHEFLIALSFGILQTIVFSYTLENNSQHLKCKINSYKHLPVKSNSWRPSFIGTPVSNAINHSRSIYVLNFQQQHCGTHSRLVTHQYGGVGLR